MAAATVAAPTPPLVGDTLNQTWKNDKTKFGLKMLQKMGWTEGKGLGKNEDGVSEHVKVSKKSNNLGLGATRDMTGAAGWNNTAVSFNGVLEALGKAYGTGVSDQNGAKRKKEKKKAKRKGGKDKGSKEKKRKKGGATLGGDESSAESSDEENDGGSGDAGAAQGAFACPSRARRVRSKDVKSFSTADLRAILGQSAGPALPSYPVIGVQKQSGSGTGQEKTSKVSGSSSSSSSSSSKKKNKQATKRRREDAGNDGVSPSSSRRPRTRSMDLAETAVDVGAATVAAAPVTEGAISSARPRTRSMDQMEGVEGAVEAAAGREEAVISKSKKKAKKKGERIGESDERKGEGGGQELVERRGEDEDLVKKKKKGRRGIKEDCAEVGEGTGEVTKKKQEKRRKRSNKG